MSELQMIWSWQPALYLFLGGMGAGAFIMAAIISFVDRVGSARTICISMWASTACLVVGLLLLVSELTNPLRGMLLWQSFSNGSSWMTFGAWAVFAAVIVFGASALLATEPFGKAVAQRWEGYLAFQKRARGPLCVAGIALGICVAVYTGVLLMCAPGVPLWNTPLLPCLFTVSALDTGVALVEITALALAKRDRVAHRVHRLMARIVIALGAIECVVLAGFLGSALGLSGAAGSAASTAAYSAGLLTTGALAPLFWILVVLCGLAVPLIGAIAGLRASRRQAADTKPGNNTIIGAAGALVGGCTLRFLILMAGVHADPVAETVASLLFQR